METGTHTTTTTTGRRRAAFGLGIGIALLAASRRRARRALRRGVHSGARRWRYARGRLAGARYRLAGRHPAEDVGDDVLVDRVRSSLGTLEKRLDTPRIHVSVFDRVAHLHGDVPSLEAQRRLIDATMRVPGIAGVESFLHIGLLASDSRPSEGRAVREPSLARRALLTAAQAAGAAAPAQAVRATLATLMARLPEGERRHVEEHLPPDVKVFAEPPVRAGKEIHDVRELVEVVQGTGALHGTANPTAVVEEIVAALRVLVPDEAGDVAAVLPKELAQFWHDAGV